MDTKMIIKYVDKNIAFYISRVFSIDILNLFHIENIISRVKRLEKEVIKILTNSLGRKYTTERSEHT